MPAFCSDGSRDLIQACDLLLLLLAKFDEGGALAAFVLGGFGDGGYVRMRLEEVANAATQDAGAVTVNNADARESGKEGAVKILLELFGGFIDGTADEIDLHAH